MRVLLDENLPVELATELTGHDVATVAGLGWQGIRNGELMLRTSRQFEALVTMDRNIEFQQRLDALPFGVVIVRAHSNRMTHLRPLAGAILASLSGLRPGTLARVGP